MIKTASLAILSVFIATAGQLLLRAGMERVGYVGFDRIARPLTLIMQVAKEPRVVFGLGVFALSAVMWLVVLSRAPLSVAYPFAGLTYILTTLFARYFLNEKVTAARWLGVGLILVGIILVGRSSPEIDTAPPAASHSRSR